MKDPSLFTVSANRTGWGSLSDQDLMRRMQTGDEGALEALYDQYGGLIYTLALRIVGDRLLAQEVLQDTFLRCWDGAERYDIGRGAVPAWLIVLARNRAIDLLRSRQHQARLRETVSLPGGETTYEPSVPDGSDGVILRQLVSGALAGLPPAQREAIELAYYDGLTQAEIARRLDAPLGTIKTRMRDGLDRLRGVLRPALSTSEEATGHNG